MFRNRASAAHKLASALRNFMPTHPLILAIPRGGIETGAVLAQELDGELDVVLSRKLRAPDQPELAIGAISENGQVHLNHRVVEALDISEEYLEQEKQHQLSEIARRKQLFRKVGPAASISGRAVVLTDDGIATGSTMMAALQTVRAQHPSKLIVAVPVAPFDRLAAFEEHCDKVVCLRAPAEFWAVGQYYEEFPTVDDERVVELLQRFAPAGKAHADSVQG